MVDAGGATRKRRWGGMSVQLSRRWRGGEPRGRRVLWVVIAGVTLLTLVFFTGVYRPPLAFLTRSSEGTSQQQQQHQQQEQQQQQQQQHQQQRRPVDDADTVLSGPSVDAPTDKYLGGLLSTSFDERSCLSRYQSSMYRKPSPHKPSPYLVERLRRYEQLHRRCAPDTALYNRTLKYLNTGSVPEKETECKYVVWAPWAGLGNRMLTLASTFLYALLTDRVLLIDRGKDITSLFCEPFPETTWLLPSDFPIHDFTVFHHKHPRSYGNMWKKNRISYNDADGGALPSVFYIHMISGDYSIEDMHFFCEPDQAVLQRVPWLLMRSDLYFVPELFLNQGFEPTLSRMFPEKDAVFHHLSRYLFHPTNKVWGMITRYYRAYLAMARERLGIQIRIFSLGDSPFEVVFRQVINCTLKEKLLPKVDADESSADAKSVDPTNTKAVLLTSLYSEFFEKIKDMYFEHPAAGGAVVSFHQPTHEERQQTGSANHDEKAWAEMYLLSLADMLVTSAWSTFGYIAQGLGGTKPWMLVRPYNADVPEPTCVRDISMEPCLHKPSLYVCRKKDLGDNGNVVPFVTHCVDVDSGIKLVDRT